MSWQSEHKEFLFANGEILKVNHTRGNVSITQIPKQSTKTDKQMRERSHILYGSTKFTDIQIVYFYRKHNGVATRAAKDLGANYQGYLQRLSKLNLKPIGSPPQKYTDADIRDAFAKANGNVTRMSIILGAAVITIRTRITVLGLKPNKMNPGSKGLTMAIINKALKKHKGSKLKAAEELGVAHTTIYYWDRKIRAKKRKGGDIN